MKITGQSISSGIELRAEICSGMQKEIATIECYTNPKCSFTAHVHIIIKKYNTHTTPQYKV